MMNHNNKRGFGIVLSNGHFAVPTKSFFDCYNVSNGTWERLESAQMEGAISSVVRIGAFTILAISLKEAKVSDERLQRWSPLPLKIQDQWAGGVLVESNGGSFSAYLANMTAVSLNC
jgi:hypothetical protein